MSISEALRFGILGAASIAPRALLAPARRRADVVVSAVAARSPANAERFARAHGIDRAFGEYQALLDDPSVDIVYVALPPSLHAEWSLRAISAGKHVLCEKPFAMNAPEAREVVEAGRSAGVRVLEAFHDHHHPLRSRVAEITAELGPVLRVSGEFLAMNAYVAGDFRHEPSFGGGSLMDLGCYPLHWMRSLLGEEPRVIDATQQLNPSGADSSITAELAFSSGASGFMRSSMSSPTYVEERRVHAERGDLTVRNSVFASEGHSIVWTREGVEHHETVSGRETYDHQLAAVLAAVRDDEPLDTEGEDIVANMQLIDAVRRSAFG